VDFASAACNVVEYKALARSDRAQALTMRDGFIDALERQLKQEISVNAVLICEWERP
jgi:hypothetical protein